MDEVTVIMPTGALGRDESTDDALDTLLRDIAESIPAHEGAWVEKYGVDYEDDMFMMHPYCWCEEEDCPWCMGCTCPENADHYYVDGKEVMYWEWRDFYKQYQMAWYMVRGGCYPHTVGKEFTDPDREWLYSENGSKAANARRATSHDPICPFCKGELHIDRGAIAGKPAPNFWHKSSGFRVWFYKYIGRDMETNMPVTAELLAQIRRDCIADADACR